ncbi:MAG: hypothetical protein AABX93_01780 [Nanoarchaeota archaeon]
MKKLVFVLVFALMFLPFAFAVSFSVEKVSSNEVMIKDVSGPAIFDLKITNNGGADNFQFYNLLGFSMAPKGTVYIAGGETKDIQLMIYPRDDINYNGFYTFEYFMQGSDGTNQKEKLTMKMIELGDAFETGSGEISPETNSIKIYLSNNVNFNFDELNINFDSPFFKLNKEIGLGPYEKKEFIVELNKEDFDKLTAGFYTLTAKIDYKGKEANVDGVIRFVEKDIVVTNNDDNGIIINTQTIEKKNDGNVVTETETVVKKNIISRLFTTFSPEPDSFERNGLTVYYTWHREINPGESLNVTARTNWLFPLLVIFFIVAIVVLTKQYSRTHVVLRKKISFVHAKGGEFALKVTIIVNSRAHVERVNVVDRIPHLVNLYNKFGGERPTRVNEKLKRIEWDLGNMDKGEKRVLSYLIYSKVGVMGKFALPESTAVYEREGEIHEAESNKAFFIAEQRKRDE